MDIRKLNEVPAFITKDGSEIRELLAHRNSCLRNQSLAEARLPAGQSTQEHLHVQTEEIYYITAGHGRMQIESETREVTVGDAIAIAPGSKHKIWNTGQDCLTFLCCCAPAYEDDDTVITERILRTAKRVRLFIKPYCGWCHEAMEWLDARGIDYEVLDVISNAGARQEMFELSGQTLTPTLDVDGEILADFDTEQLEEFWAARQRNNERP